MEPVYITAWHPVYIGGKWTLPLNCSTPCTLPCSHVYSFVLKNRCASLVMNDCIPVATLAHGLKGDVIEHPFWGTEAVVQSLRTLGREGEPVQAESSSSARESMSAPNPRHRNGPPVLPC